MVRLTGLLLAGVLDAVDDGEASEYAGGDKALSISCSLQGYAGVGRLSV